MAKRITEEEMKNVGDALVALANTTSAQRAKDACQPIHEVHMTVVQRENLPDVAGEEKVPHSNRFSVAGSTLPWKINFKTVRKN